MTENAFMQTLAGEAASAQGNVSSGAEILAQNDPFGAIMALMGMGIVFTVLLLLFTIFNNTPALFRASFRSRIRQLLSFKKADKAQATQVAVVEEVPQAELSGEVNAAIAAAIHLYRSEMHDFEDTVLTIKKVSKTYSPWSSKIYGVRNALQRN
jgi:glutaconyl-CoA/methylmalonyl-CoA decarboxylase subunit delta